LRHGRHGGLNGRPQRGRGRPKPVHGDGQVMRELSYTPDSMGVPAAAGTTTALAMSSIVAEPVFLRRLVEAVGAGRVENQRQVGASSPHATGEPPPAEPDDVLVVPDALAPGSPGGGHAVVTSPLAGWTHAWDAHHIHRWCWSDRRAFPGAPRRTWVRHRRRGPRPGGWPVDHLVATRSQGIGLRSATTRWCPTSAGTALAGFNRRAMGRARARTRVPAPRPRSVPGHSLSAAGGRPEKPGGPARFPRPHYEGGRRTAVLRSVAADPATTSGRTDVALGSAFRRLSHGGRLTADPVFKNGRRTFG